MFEIIFLASKKIACSEDADSPCRGIPSKELSKRKVSHMAASSFIRFFPDILAELPKMFEEFKGMKVSELLCDPEGSTSVVFLMQTGNPITINWENLDPALCGAARIWDCLYKEHPQLVCWSEEYDLAPEDLEQIEEISKTIQCY